MLLMTLDHPDCQPRMLDTQLLELQQLAVMPISQGPQCVRTVGFQNVIADTGIHTIQPTRMIKIDESLEVEAWKLTVWISMAAHY